MMGREWRVACGLLVTVAIALSPVCLETWRGGDTARAFMPGELGSEPGRSAPGPSPRAYLTRAISAGGGEEGEAWARENGLTRALSFSHNLLNVFPPSLFGEHPEFFPLESGVRFRPPEGTYFWQPDIARKDVAAYAAEAARRFFDEHPGAESFSLGVNDGLKFGESPELLELVLNGHEQAQKGAETETTSRCSLKGPAMGADVSTTPATNEPPHSAAAQAARATMESSGGDARTNTRGRVCSPDRNGAVGAPQLQRLAQLKWFRERPDYSPLVFTFMNRVADDLARTYPDKLLGCLAYYWCEDAPDFPVRRQVVPFLTADRTQGYDVAFWREEALLQRRWVRAKQSDKGRVKSDKNPANDAGRLGLYDYLEGAGFLVPRIHTRLLAENLRRARRAGFTDYFAESHSNWGLDGPMLWLAAQLLQDPEQSPEALLDEYYRRFFREAAVPMRWFFVRCERQWMTQPGDAYWLKHYRNESQADLFPSAVCRELRGLLADAAGAVASDPVARQRVKFVSDAFGVTERFVTMQETRVKLYRSMLGSNSSWRQTSGLLGKFEAARDDFEGYTRGLREREPLAVPPFHLDDYLRDDPGSGALLAIARKAAAAHELAAAVSAVAHDPDSQGIMAGAGIEGAELLRNGSLAGTLQPAKLVAGLPFGIALPPPWLSFVEPCQHFEAERIDGATPVLRLRGNKNTQLYQWVRARPDKWHIVRMAIRGRISSGGVANLMLGWLGEDNAHLGLQVTRLPEGNWPDWVELELAAKPPEGATWAGVGLRVGNQMQGDWLEVRNFSLKAVEGAGAAR